MQKSGTPKSLAFKNQDQHWTPSADTGQSKPMEGEELIYLRESLEPATATRQVSTELEYIDDSRIVDIGLLP